MRCIQGLQQSGTGEMDDYRRWCRLMCCARWKSKKGSAYHLQHAERDLEEAGNNRRDNLPPSKSLAAAIPVTGKWFLLGVYSFMSLDMLHSPR